MNTTITASILVIISSLGLGLLTGWFSFEMGSDSLKGVKSPSENPSQKISPSNGNEKIDLSQKKDFKIIEEKRIIVTVYDYVQEQRGVTKEEDKK